MSYLGAVFLVLAGISSSTATNIRRHVAAALTGLFVVGDTIGEHAEAQRLAGTWLPDKVCP